MDFLKFLGTGGARFVVSQQLRSSGGIWLSLDGVQVLIDPGPGSLVKCISSQPKLDPVNLDGIILTHRHLDHTCDVNIMIEAMTKGGYQKKGIVFAPEDALEHDPVVLRYVRSYLSGLETLKEGGSYALGPIRFSTPLRHQHPVETYGLKFSLPQGTLSLIADTLYFPELIEYYTADCIILNVVRLSANSPNIIYHLCLDDARTIIGRLKPHTALLTHFGTAILEADPEKLAAEISSTTGVRVIACTDGMTFSLGELLASR